MKKLKYHLEISNKIIRCKNCNTLKMIRFLDDTLCEKCEKQYVETVNSILQK